MLDGAMKGLERVYEGLTVPPAISVAWIVRDAWHGGDGWESEACDKGEEDDLYDEG